MKLEDKRKLEENIVLVLKNIFDPEIPVNIFDLGLIYEIQVSDDADVKVIMTLTAPNCPVADSMPNDVKRQVADVTGVKSADVEITFDPPWDKEMISDAAKLDLGLL